MKKILQKLGLSLSAMVAIMTPAALVAAPVYAQPVIDDGLCQGANLDVGGSTNCDQDDPQGTVNDIITTVINIFSVVVGVVAVIMIIIGGIRYITAGGDSGNVSSAKQAILGAIIGLVIVALAQVVVRFVLTRVTEAT